MNQSEHGEQLDPFEEWARDRLSAILGPFRTTDRPGGRPGMHDFEVDLVGGSVAAIEVTSEVDSKRLDQAASAEGHLSGLTLPGSRWLWLVGLSAGARVRSIKDDLLKLLTDIESQGHQSAYHFGSFSNPFVQRLAALGIESAHAVKAKAGSEGKVIVRPGTYSGWGLGRSKG